MINAFSKTLSRCGVQNIGDSNEMSSSSSQDSGYTEPPLPADRWAQDAGPDDSLMGVFGGSDDLVRCVMAQTGCQDPDLVHDILVENSFECEASIVRIRQLMSAESPCNGKLPTTQTSTVCAIHGCDSDVVVCVVCGGSDVVNVCVMYSICVGRLPG